MQNARLDKAEAGIKIAGRNINNLRYEDDTTLMVESEEELKSFLDESEREWKAGLKLNIQKMKIMASCPITSRQINGETVETVTDFIFWAPNSVQRVTAAMKLKDTYSLEESYDQPRQHIKKQRLYFANKGLSSHGYGFSCSSHVWIWELDYRESWVLKNWWFWPVVLEKTLESPLDCKEIQSVHPKGDQSWLFIGRTDAEAETPILWPPDVKNWLIWKDPDAGKDWRREDEMVGWHHWLNGHSLSKLRELVMDREAWRAAVHGVT